MNQHLTQLGSQLLGIWKQLGLNQKISITLASGVVLAGLLALALWSSRSKFDLLYGSLSHSAAGKIVEYLDEAQVPYKIERNGTAIFVPSSQVDSLRIQLAKQGVPQADNVGFEIFDNPSFGISDFVQRTNYKRAIEGELARTIGNLDAIERAWVHINSPENRLILDRDKKPSASVTVQSRGLSRISQGTVDAIRFVVANAVEGMKVESVAVMDTKGRVLAGNEAEDSIGGLTSSQLGAKRELEAYLADKAETMLDRVLGTGQSVVKVDVDLDLETVTRTEQNFDPVGIVRSETVNNEISGSTETTDGGVPGVATNANTGTNAPPAGPLANSETNNKLQTTQYEISSTNSTIIKQAGGVRRISAGVVLAAKVTGTGAERIVQQRTKEELDSLRLIVQSAIGIQDAGTGVRDDEINLMEIAFDDEAELEFARRIEKDQRLEFWLTIGRQVFYPTVALGVLALFWRMLKRSAEPIPVGVPVGALTGDGIGSEAGTEGRGDADEEEEEAIPERMTVDSLNQMVRDNPENVTEAIRAWLIRSKPNNN